MTLPFAAFWNSLRSRYNLADAVGGSVSWVNRVIGASASFGVQLSEFYNPCRDGLETETPNALLSKGLIPQRQRFPRGFFVIRRAITSIKNCDARWFVSQIEREASGQMNHRNLRRTLCAGHS